MIVVIGCGNPNRRDDGIGPEVIRALRSRDLASDEGVRLLDAGTDGMATMFAARGCRAMIVVDACRSGSEPGAIFEVPGSALEQAYEPALNLHDFRWDHALHAGRKIFRDDFPTDVSVLLVEAATVDFGIGLSSPVAAAAAKVVDRIEALVGARLTLGPSRDMSTTVTLKHGSLYLTHEVYDLYFAGLEAIILLRRGEDLLILPVRHAAAGGYILKRRNGAGDRVVTAPDFFREHGIDDTEREVPVVWSSANAGMAAASLFRSQT